MRCRRFRLRLAGLSVLLVAAAALLNGCSVVLALGRSADLELRETGALLGFFRFNGNLTAAEGTLSVEGRSAELVYAAPHGGGEGVTRTVTAEDFSDGAGYAEILDIPLPDGRLPGTIALWIRRPDESTAEETTNVVLRGAIQLRTGQTVFSGTRDYEDELLTLDIELPLSPVSFGTSSFRLFSDEFYLTAVEVFPGNVADPFYHLAVTLDASGAARLYANGEVEESYLAYSRINPENEPLRLLLETGNAGVAGGVVFDNLRIYEHALSSSEIREIYGSEVEEMGSAGS